MKLNFKFLLLLNLLVLNKTKSMESDLTPDLTQASNAELSSSSSQIQDPNKPRVLQKPYFSWVYVRPQPLTQEIEEREKWESLFKLVNSGEHELSPDELERYNQFVEERGQVLFNSKKLPDLKLLKEFQEFQKYLIDLEQNQEQPKREKIVEINEWVKKHPEMGLPELPFPMQVRDDKL